MRELTRARRLRHRLERGERALVLTYHRIGGALTDPWRLAVPQARFDEQMEILRRRFRPTSMAGLLSDLAAGGPSHRTVVVTFDDGYADNLHAALPILERHEMPATMFLTAGHLGATREFWWKEVERLLLEPGRLPERLEVHTRALSRSWALGASGAYTEADARPYEQWVVNASDDSTHDVPATPRHAAFQALLRAMAPLDAAERWEIVDALVHAAGDPAPRESHRMLTPEEARRLADSPLIEVGAHTMSHPRLSELTVGAQQQEIVESKARLEEIAERAVTSFAYPFGQPGDYTGTTVALVREAGFRCAGVVRDIAVSRSSRPLELPRVGVVDCPAEQFEARLEWWLRRGL